MTKLYGILQDLGECIETQNIEYDLQEYIGNNSFSIEKYKELKPFSSKGGIRTFRGFADSKTLAHFSMPDEHYQRSIDKNHREKIEEYIIKSSQDSIYFPEVTLLYMYDDTLSPDDLPFQSIIKDFTNKNKDIQSLSTMYALGIYSLILEENNKLFRLDGNHRLEVLGKAANQGIQKDKNKKRTKNNLFKTNRLISFCIILTPRVENYSIEHLYFYLLNAKALPINSIKVLELITNANKDNFLKEFISKDENLCLLDSIKESWKNFDDNEKEVLLRVVNEIINEIRTIDTNNNEKRISMNELKVILEQSIGIYRDAKMKKDILGIICFLRLKSNDSDDTQKKLNKFYEWIEKFNYDISHFKKFGDLYEAFAKYNDEMQRKRYIFVAMEFNETYIEEYESAIGNVMQQIKGRNSRINFELIPIMEQSGDVVIPQKIFDDIDKCDIFIADISTNNINVMLEYGYAKGKENKYTIAFYNEDWNNEVLKELETIETNHIKKIKADLQNKPFDIRVNNHNKWKNKNELEEKLQREFGNYLKENHLD